MKDLEEIILSYDTKKKLTESAAYPLVAYGVINYISAKELHEYFTENGLKVSLSSVQNWRRNAARILDLAPPNKGRQSYAKQKQMRDEWKRINGCPTIKMLMDGWMPKRVLNQSNTSANKSEQHATYENEISSEPTPIEQSVRNGSSGDIESENIQKSSTRSGVKKGSSGKQSSPPQINLDEIERPKQEDLDVTKFINGE